MKNKPKIAHVVCTFPPYQGGMGNVARENCRLLAERGYDVTLFTPRYRYLADVSEREEKDGFKIFRFKTLIESGNAALVPQVVWLLRKYDVIHLHYPFYGAGIFVGLAKIIGPAKLVVHYHMDNIATGAKNVFFRGYRALILPQLLKLADKVVVHSRDYAFNCYGSWWLKFFAHKLVEIPNGVDTNSFTPLPNYKDKFLKKPKQLLFVGGLDKAHYFKGVDILLQAVSKLRHQDWLLDIVGGGELLEDYRNKAHLLGLKNKVLFPGRADDPRLREFYRNAYLTILPSFTRGEAFGMVLIESMSSGTPVLTTNLPGVRVVVDDQINGLLAKPGDAEDLRSKLDYLLTHSSALTDMATGGLEKARQYYDWQIIGDKLASLYENLLS
ncbi:MAG: glycosyltransferase family 4 protein [Candidatus Komeilibacteria bacterium]|nr:glycosyltransferase family 4 protein [Candidatus Komeilibacteria bacterium]